MAARKRGGTGVKTKAKSKLPAKKAGERLLSKPRARPKKAKPKRTATKGKAPKKKAPLRRALAAPPSERAMAVSAARPLERSLTDEEREAMAKVALTASRSVGLEGAPTTVVRAIATFLDDVRGGGKGHPSSQDVRLGLGVLWGEQLRAQVGWTWVHLSYPDGFASYALVPDDRAFACFPLNRIPELMDDDARANTSMVLFESIRTGALPLRRANAYLVIG